MESQSLNRNWIPILKMLLRPIMRFCLKHCLSIQEVIEAAKEAIIEVAVENAEVSKQKVSVSKLSVMTGLHRRDVIRLYRDRNTSYKSGSIITRLIGQWQKDTRFTTKNGKPRVLSFNANESDFNVLVSLISTDVHPGTVLNELERLSYISKSSQGLKLEATAHVPSGDIDESFAILEQDVEGLINTVQTNTLYNPKVPNLHVHTEYDSIRKDSLDEIKNWVLEEGSKFHKKIRNFLSKHDLDITPDKDYTGEKIKVVIGSFSHVET